MQTELPDTPDLVTSSGGRAPVHIGHLNLFSSDSRHSHTSALLQLVPLGSLLRRGHPNDRGIAPRSRPEPSTSSLFDRSRICKTPPWTSMHYGHEDLGPRTGDGPRRGNSYGSDNVNNEAILIGARRWVSKRRRWRR